MRYIDKTKLQAPALYDAELRVAQLDEASILGGTHAGLSGSDLFDNGVKRLTSYKLMREQLLEDQGYVCCYCNRGDITEHVKPKSIYRELVGEYKNLLIACEGGQIIPSTMAPSRSKQFRRMQYPLHCDQKKGNDELLISPITRMCEWRVHYDPLTGKVYGDSEVMDMEMKLNLNHPALIKERKEEIKNWCYDSSGNALSNDQLEKVFTKMMTREADGRYHNLYYVIASAAMELVR